MMFKLNNVIKIKNNYQIIRIQKSHKIRQNISNNFNSNLTNMMIRKKTLNM